MILVFCPDSGNSLCIYCNVVLLWVLHITHKQMVYQSGIIVIWKVYLVVTAVNSRKIGVNFYLNVSLQWTAQFRKAQSRSPFLLFLVVYLHYLWIMLWHHFMMYQTMLFKNLCLLVFLFSCRSKKRWRLQHTGWLPMPMPTGAMWTSQLASRCGWAPGIFPFDLALGSWLPNLLDHSLL